MPLPFRGFMLIHLHCHSHYSFLRGIASPDEIIAAAVEQHMPAVALTDTNGMHAAVSFYKKAKDKKIKPIVGVTLDVEWPFDSAQNKRVTSGPSKLGASGINEWRERAGEIPRFARNDSFESEPIVLLAMDMEGYSNLCALTTLRHLGTTKLGCLPAQQATANHLRMRSFASLRMTSEENGADEASPSAADGRPVTLQELAEHSRGVIALCPLPARTRDASNRRGTIYRAPTKM